MHTASMFGQCNDTLCRRHSIVENAGTLIYYLPPYSPDFNPIEEAFSKVKRQMKITGMFLILK